MMERRSNGSWLPWSLSRLPLEKHLHLTNKSIPNQERRRKCTSFHRHSSPSPLISWFSLKGHFHIIFALNICRDWLGKKLEFFENSIFQFLRKKKDTCLVIIQITRKRNTVFPLFHHFAFHSFSNTCSTML